MLADFPFPVVSVVGDRVEAELARLRQGCSGTNSVPVVVGDRESAMRLVELFDQPFDQEAEFSAAASLSPEAWFAERRKEGEEYIQDDSQSEIHPRGTTPMTRLTVGHDYRNRPRPEVFIATVPGSDFTAIPIHLRFGGWNACPCPHVHMALARYWGDRYGALIATISSDIVEFTVERPPVADAQALELAWQQYFYCADIVDQGVGSVATLAQALRHSTRWFFWWD
jgi:hypothetical protein